MFTEELEADERGRSVGHVGKYLSIHYCSHRHSFDNYLWPNAPLLYSKWYFEAGKPAMFCVCLYVRVFGVSTAYVSRRIFDEISTELIPD